jgi:hypothetical protein
MRLHAGMLAVANGVPALFIGHDTRTYSFCEMMGLECIELFADTRLHWRLAIASATCSLGMLSGWSPRLRPLPVCMPPCTNSSQRTGCRSDRRT